MKLEYNNDIRISVVLASFNGERFILAQLNSWLQYLSENDEIIVSDDSSTDSTRDIVRSLQDRRVRLLPQDARLGYQGNFQRAILQATGKYIFFSDQDDICLPNRISLSLQALCSYGCICGDAVVVDEVLRPKADSYFVFRGSKNFSAWHLFAKPAVIGATMACSREFIRSALPFPTGIPHDQWLSVLAAARGELHILVTPLILYRRHVGTASLTGYTKKRPFTQVVNERVRLIYALLSWYGRRIFRSTSQHSTKTHL